MFDFLAQPAYLRVDTAIKSGGRPPAREIETLFAAENAMRALDQHNKQIVFPRAERYGDAVVAHEFPRAGIENPPVEPIAPGSPGLIDVRALAPPASQHRLNAMSLRLPNGFEMWHEASTMTRVFEECHHAGFAAVSAYALGGGRTVEEEGAELKSAIASFKDLVGTTGLQVYAMTVPTHYADRYCRRHFGKSIHLQVRAMCLEASEAAADGVIMPALLHAVEDISLKKILPGMRPKWFQDTRHKHEYQPEVIAGMENVESVCGRPYTRATIKWALSREYLRRFKSKNLPGATAAFLFVSSLSISPSCDDSRQ